MRGPTISYTFLVPTFSFEALEKATNDKNNIPAIRGTINQASVGFAPHQQIIELDFSDILFVPIRIVVATFNRIKF